MLFASSSSKLERKLIGPHLTGVWHLTENFHVDFDKKHIEAWVQLFSFQRSLSLEYNFSWGCSNHHICYEQLCMCCMHVMLRAAVHRKHACRRTCCWCIDWASRFYMHQALEVLEEWDTFLVFFSGLPDVQKVQASFWEAAMLLSSLCRRLCSLC